MTEAFVETETDRTKSRWIARVYQDFVKESGRSRTTLRALFYYALQRKVSDYPICGGFVGEIRITRPYDESDGERLPKWASRARKLGFIPLDFILDDIPGEHVFLPEVQQERPYSIEIWVNKSALNPLVHPTCEKHGTTLVSVSGNASKEAIRALYQRYDCTTIVLCLSDLSTDSFSFCRDLALKIAELKPSVSQLDIRLKRIGLVPEQVLKLKIPMVHGRTGSKEDQGKFKKYLDSYALDPRRMAELDALEVYYPGGIAGFVDDALTKYSLNFDLDNEEYLLDLKRGVFPRGQDIDTASSSK